jgi:DNA-binding response OmpR family regulator
MVGLKHILVVDDHFEMLEFLRSMLELTNRNYRVLGVPSAEEGLLELRRRTRQGEPFDLLITDVRLPGMSGFELARKVRELRADLPIMIITAYASAQGRKEAEQLSVHRYFEKPLDTDAMLASVHSALYPDAGAPPPAPKPAGAEPALPRDATLTGATDPAPEAIWRQEIARRTQALLSDTGAVQALLCDRQGRILVRVGAATQQPLERLAQLLARTMTHSFALAAELGSDEPFTIQYQAGERVDLYTANVGRHAFLVLLFDARARRGRIGTVWVFAQRAIKDILDVLPAPGEGRRQETTPAGPPQTAHAAPRHREQGAQQERQDAPQEATRAAGASPTIACSEEDAAALLDLLDQAKDLGSEDLDAFWDEAAADAGRDDMNGLTFDEAMRRGLLPPDMGS